MRIIGGSARGRRLFAPPGENTRPTADRVREALFNILAAPAGWRAGFGFVWRLWRARAGGAEPGRRLRGDWR